MRRAVGLLIGIALFAPALGFGAVVTEVYTDRAAFDARVGTVRVVGFDDVDAGTVDPAAFAADRYAPQGIVITGEGGQYASRSFGFPADYPPSSAPNEYAPGPIEGVAGGGNETSVTFVASGGPGAVAAFGVVFIDPDVAGIAGFSVFDRDDTMLDGVSAPAADAGTVFRGIVTVDDTSGMPTAAIARVEITNGTGWPAADFNDGVPLDDFAFGVPAELPAGSTTTTIVSGSTTTTTVPSCAGSPRDACLEPVVSAVSKLRIRSGLPDRRKNLLRWVWGGGAATGREDFGDPTTTTSYAVCVYDAGTLVFDERIPADGTCGPKLCWKRTLAGFVYRDPIGAVGGIRALRLRAGGDGQARITLVGRGPGLDAPALPLAPPITVQLVRDGGACWNARYSLPRKNTTRQLRTSGD